VVLEPNTLAKQFQKLLKRRTSSSVSEKLFFRRLPEPLVNDAKLELAH
jgi:hypothetical protein